MQWHSLSRDEQSKYYEMARKERQLHMQLYPGWTARDNYAINSKKKKRKKDKTQDGGGTAFWPPFHVSLYFVLAQRFLRGADVSLLKTRHETVLAPV